MTEPKDLPDSPGLWWEASNDWPTYIYQVSGDSLRCGNCSTPRQGFWLRIEKPLFGPTVSVAKPGLKFRVTMKDPDTLHDAIVDAVRANLSTSTLDLDEREAVFELRRERLQNLCERMWFEYGEYLTVEIDTGAMTCLVVGRNK